MLGSELEGLLDDHHLKPRHLFDLSRLPGTAFNHAECRQHRIHTLELLERAGWIPRAKGTLEIYERLSDKVEQANDLQYLALLTPRKNPHPAR